MTHYYYDSKAKKFYGPIYRMPPDFQPPTNHIPHECTCHICEAYRIEWDAFHGYLSTLQPITHTFIGHSRIVPEGEIEWEERDGFVRGNYMNICKVCKVHFGATDKLWFLCPTHSKYKVATPKITAQTSCASVNQGMYCMCAKEGYDMTQCPHYRPSATQAPGYTSGSGGEEGDLHDAVLQYRDSHPEPNQVEESLLDIAKSMYESARKLLEKLK